MNYDLIFGGGSVLFLVSILVAILYTAIGNMVSWKKLKRKGFMKRTEETDDFMEENRRILDLVEERMDCEANVFQYGGKKESPTVQELRDSSEIASLSRYAHFGGVYITVEQIPSDGSDADDGDPNVFKTDLSKAAENREKRKWEPYRR